MLEKIIVFVSSLVVLVCLGSLKESDLVSSTPAVVVLLLPLIFFSKK